MSDQLSSPNAPSPAPHVAAAPPEGTLRARWHRLPARVRAALSWLAGSIVIGALLLSLVFLVWYPGNLAEATGVAPIFAMMFGIDLTLGPFVVLLIFNPKKRSLRMDLAIIAVVQVAALSYGLYSIFIVRPAYIVYNVDRFDVVVANDIDPASEKRVTDDRYRSAPLTGPLFVGARLPADKAERNKILLSSVAGGFDLPQLPEYYAPLSEVSDQIRSRLQPLSILRKGNATADAALLAKLAAYERRGDAVGFVPVRVREMDLSAIIDRASAAVLELLPLDPWGPSAPAQPAATPSAPSASPTPSTPSAPPKAAQ